MAQPASITELHGKKRKDSKQTLLQHAANELVFAVVGHVGSGTSEVARALQNLLEDSPPGIPSHKVEVIKATEVIAEWATASGKALPATDRGKKSLSVVESYQDLGDAMRLETDDHAAVAKGFAMKIREQRAKQLRIPVASKEPVLPDGTPRAYVLDSIRHPAEVELLRHIYQEAFFLIGVVCEENKRLTRVTSKYSDAGSERAKDLMKRDAKASDKHGQRVSDAFHLADFFVDNTADRHNGDGTSNQDWDVNEKLSRLLKIIRHSEIVRPEVSETAMLHAHGAAMRSACLSRQVGAALVDGSGNVIATGCNEVPKAGGGVYGEGFSPNGQDDHRCAYRKIQGKEKAFCSNTQEQNQIIDGLINAIGQIKEMTGEERTKITDLFRTGRVGGLLEFSRAVHAEMDAILTAGRKGATTLGTRLFVTTFPCHYCARHIVAAGIDEVQYIEPYPKSQALQLHCDSIVETASGWQAPSAADGKTDGASGRRKVLFRPFAGVAPRLYRRAFGKDRELKDEKTGYLNISSPQWGSPWHLRQKSYAQLEVELAEEGWK